MDVQLLVLAQTAHQRPWSTSHTELIVLRLCVFPWAHQLAFGEDAAALGPGTGVLLGAEHARLTHDSHSSSLFFHCAQLLPSVKLQQPLVQAMHPRGSARPAHT